MYEVDLTVLWGMGEDEERIDSLHGYTYRLRIEEYGPEADLVYRAPEIPQGRNMIAAYQKNKKAGTQRKSRPRSKKYP